MTITIGTSVRITATCAHRTQAGTVTAIVEGQHHPYAVAGLAPWELWFSSGELEIIQQPQEAA